MGTKLSIGDFVNVLKKSKGVLIGTVLVYTIMPLTGVLLVKSYGFVPEIAAVVILIGSCPGGMASNVMTFLAKGNVALSETDCRTLSIEVGLKNGGMGVELAINVLKSGEASLASLIFGSWMNISGSTLANFWRQKPVMNGSGIDNQQ